MGRRYLAEWQGEVKIISNLAEDRCREKNRGNLNYRKFTDDLVN